MRRGARRRPARKPSLGGGAASTRVEGVFTATTRVEGFSLQVTIIDDPEELERLCTRPAAGALEDVGWNVDMAEMCGETYTIIECHGTCCSYTFEEFDNVLPYDACILHSEDE